MQNWENCQTIRTRKYKDIEARALKTNGHKFTNVANSIKMMRLTGFAIASGKMLDDFSLDRAKQKQANDFLSKLQLLISHRFDKWLLTPI